MTKIVWLNKIFRTTLATLFFTYYLILPDTNAFAGNLPEDPDVKIGDPSISSSDTEMTIDAGNYDKTWIDWQGGFNIAAGNTVNNIGPSLSAAILHNDVSGAISDIQGALNGNCQVFLLNPSGILFSPTAQVNVAGLVASTLMMSQDDFLAGNYAFSGDNDLATVVNAGDITATNGGDITLIGGAVQNLGTIRADLGTVNLAAGKGVTLNISGDGSIQAVVSEAILDNVYDQDGDRVAVGVENLGTISANGGSIYIEVEAVQDVFDTLVNQEGVIRAGSMVERDGKIVLVSASEGIIQNTGTMDVSGIENGASGGEIEMTGDVIGQFGEIHADGMGEADGGNIDIYAKNIVALNEVSLTTANAGSIGDGGTVTVFSPDTALFWNGALIEARGGSQSGNGGFVEVSGLENVYVRGMVDASASSGIAGTFLIDPTDITIQSAAGDIDGDVDGTYTPSANTNTISDGAIETLLNAGTSVVISTVSGFSGPGGGDITQNADASIGFTGAGGAATLGLTAESDIVLNGGITAAGNTLGVTLAATGAVDINAAIGTNGGTFASSGTTFDNTGGAITTGGGTVDITHSGAITIAADITSTDAAISIANTTSDIRITHSSGTIDAGTSTVTLRADDMTLGGTSIIGNGGINIYTTDADTIIQLDTTEEIAEQLELSAAMLQTLSSSGTVTIGENGVNSGAIQVGGAATNLSGETFSLTLATEGAIDDVTGSSNVITLANGKTFTLDAGTSIGATNAVNTAATIINADAGSSNLTLTNTGNVTDLQLNANS
ncbi:MAG: filamentous hemagglutinin N-terminal domain-containing protein, partial [Candidatus Omnitrophica bacterium]|nr:filamentous hemagglutinin N-terminal domain-containing protein [Candidatus Omnitrophota bacterium]